MLSTSSCLLVSRDLVRRPMRVLVAKHVFGDVRGQRLQTASTQHRKCTQPIQLFTSVVLAIILRSQRAGAAVPFSLAAILLNLFQFASQLDNAESNHSWI